MMDERPTEREEIEMLLPWYEKGTLSAEEMRRVEHYLETDPSLRDRLALIPDEVSETIAANESLPLPSRSARDRLMEQIAAESGPARAGGAGGLGAWLSRLMPAGLSPGLGIAAAAAALVIIVQAVALVSLISEDVDRSGYQVASGEEASAAASGTFVLVKFTDDATAQEIAELLNTVDATITDGPKPGGLFRLRVAPEGLPDDQREAILDRLREREDIVAFAAPTR